MFFRDQLLYQVAQISRFFAEYDAAGTIHDQNPIHASRTDFQLQGAPPSSKNPDQKSTLVLLISQGFRAHF